jgi:hypothetical protein
MSEAAERRDVVRRACQSDPLICRLTADRLRTELAAVGLEPTKGWAWLTEAAQAALLVGIDAANIKDDQRGNRAFRDELRAIAKQARALYTSMYSVSQGARDALWEVAWKRRSKEAEDEFDPPIEHRIFDLVPEQLNQLAFFLDVASADLDLRMEPPRWHGTARMEGRIELARYLSVVFESAFGEAAIPKSEGSNHQPASYGRWAFFFDRVLTIAGVQTPSANLGEVLKTARSLHLSDPVLFEPGVLPD